jgi:hypothetical protein
MNEFYRSEDELFETARRLPTADQRRAFLERACVDAPSVRVRIEKLLSADSDADDFFRESSAALKPPEWRQEML